LFISLTKIVYIGHIKKSQDPLYTTAAKKRKAVAAKCRIHDNTRSVTDGVSLSISKLKLVYNSLIFVDDKLTLVCLLT